MKIAKTNAMNMHILAVDDDPVFLQFLQGNLGNIYKISLARNVGEAETLLHAGGIDLILLDIGLGAEDGLNLLRQIKKGFPDLDVVMVTGEKDPKFVMSAVKSGATDYLAKPFEIEELIATIEKIRPIRDIKEKHSAVIADINEMSSRSKMIGKSPAFKELLEKAGKLRGHNANVLIDGASGTGKELLARYLHKIEGKADRPFVAVNCAAIPENLLESELFGHERGSFTGAHQRKIGKFELANGGDIFLDEISCLKWDMQAKILRVLQEREICRIGGNASIRVNFRTIAATNEPLEMLMGDGKIRRDLFHRVMVVPLRVPSLKERAEDIPLLAEAFLKKYGRDDKWHFSAQALQALQNYYWPGNIRELENLIQSLVILSAGPTIETADLPEWVFRKKGDTRAHLSKVDFTLPTNADGILSLRECMGRIEMVYIKRALELTNHDKSRAASLLSISRSKLHERIKIWEVINSEERGDGDI